MKKKLTVGCLGHSKHGKSTLMFAIAAVQKAKGKKVRFIGDIGIIREHGEMMEKIMNRRCN